MNHQIIKCAALFCANAFSWHCICGKSYPQILSWQKNKTYLILFPVLTLTHWGIGLFVRDLRAITRFILKVLCAACEANTATGNIQTLKWQLPTQALHHAIMDCHTKTHHRVGLCDETAISTMATLPERKEPIYTEACNFKKRGVAREMKTA